jgi:hypothetical protein
VPAPERFRDGLLRRLCFTPASALKARAAPLRLLALFFAITPALACASDWASQAARAQLATHPEWLALLHYEKRPIRRGYRSYVDDRRFFLSEEGPANPERELAATLDAFFADPASQCRFVARRRWLVERLAGLGGALPRAVCREYREWAKLLGAKQVVLVYAASYLNSPSSMYGHTFLRFDRGDTTYDTPFLAYALNFGARIPADENGLLYAWRGLAGGYPGLFAAGPYFEKLRDYSRLENRDLWEYRLNLRPEEIERLVEHLWELRDINFDYYFFDENCSLRLLELLDVARPGHDLAQQFPNYAIPIDTVRAVIEADMVNGLEYRPASLTLLERELRQLRSPERDIAREVADSSAVAPGDALAALDPARRRAVANAAYDYLRYRAIGEARDPATARRAYDLLRIVNELPAPAEPPAPLSTPARPDHGHRTGLLALAGGYEERDAYADFEWRLSYHDLLDEGAGYPTGASLNMGRLVFRLKEESAFQLQRFDVLDITSLSPRDEFFKPLSWRVNAGWDRQWTAGDDVLVTQANAGFGGSYAPLSALTAFAFITGRVEHNNQMERELDVAPGISLGAIGRTVLGNTLIGLDRYRFTDGVDRTVWSVAHHMPIRRNLALRAGFDRRISDSDGMSEAAFALRYYF